MIDPEVWTKCLKLLGERVKAIRLAKGLTQYDVVRQHGINPSHLSKVERCANITLESLVNIAEALEVSASDLIDGMPGTVLQPKQGRKPRSSQSKNAI